MKSSIDATTFAVVFMARLLKAYDARRPVDFQVKRTANDSLGLLLLRYLRKSVFDGIERQSQKSCDTFHADARVAPREDAKVVLYHSFLQQCGKIAGGRS